MYGLPEDFDSSVFVGRNLVQVCIAINQVTFHFDNDIQITTLTEFIFTNPDKRYSSEPGNVSIEFLSLLETPVSSAIVADRGTLALEFEGNRRLIFPDTSEQYESYSIIHAGHTTIV